MWKSCITAYALRHNFEILLVEKIVTSKLWKQLPESDTINFGGGSRDFEKGEALYVGYHG